MERKWLLHAVLLGAFLDPLVDRPKDFFVVGGRIGEVHEGILPRSVPNAKRAPWRLDSYRSHDCVRDGHSLEKRAASSVTRPALPWGGAALA